MINEAPEAVNELEAGILLPDGRTVDSGGQEYKDWCEGWWVLATLPSVPGWNAMKFYERVKKSRGDAGLAALLARVEYVKPYFFEWSEAA